MIKGITCVIKPMITVITTYSFIIYRKFFFTNFVRINDDDLQRKKTEMQ